MRGPRSNGFGLPPMLRPGKRANSWLVQTVHARWRSLKRNRRRRMRVARRESERVRGQLKQQFAHERERAEVRLGELCESAAARVSALEREFEAARTSAVDEDQRSTRGQRTRAATRTEEPNPSSPTRRHAGAAHVEEVRAGRQPR
jgi:hypothetical protein